MKSFTQKVNEMKYAQPLGGQKDQMKNLLVAAAGNDQRVLNDLVNCLTDDQMEKCFQKLSKVYGYTGAYGQIVHPSI
jgi:hypothetical protein